MGLSSAREEVANTKEGHAGFGSPAHLALQNLVERYLSVEHLVEVEAVHADDALASAKGDEAVFGEAAVAHEQTSRPGCLLFDLDVEGVEIGNADWLAVPFGFQQIDVAAELEAAADLLAAQLERLLGGKAVRIE
ncbi:hypothetical protein AJ87_23580 [Rhizobium yanglingense]|nr:hypothetical protein AJ87_23580 [Rhizobium yanglingense]